MAYILMENESFLEKCILWTIVLIAYCVLVKLAWRLDEDNNNDNDDDDNGDGGSLKDETRPGAFSIIQSVPVW